MYLNKKEIEAINASIDFISHHADGADDYSPFAEMQQYLRSAWEKGMKQKRKTLKTHKRQ